MAQQSSLRIVPVHDLEQSALTAFRGALYHLDALKTFLTKPALQTFWTEAPDLSLEARSRNQETLNAFHWHLRAFFWELVGAFDAMLLWANSRFELGLTERDVMWRTVSSATASTDVKEWDEKNAILRATWESDWFFEVREYRNFAHRSFLLLQAEYVPSEDGGLYKLGLLTLLPARVGQAQCRDLIEHLSDYHEEMRKVGERVFSN